MERKADRIPNDVKETIKGDLRPKFVNPPTDSYSRKPKRTIMTICSELL